MVNKIKCLIICTVCNIICHLAMFTFDIDRNDEVNLFNTLYKHIIQQ